MEENYLQSTSLEESELASKGPDYLFDDFNENKLVRLDRPKCYFSHKIVAYLDKELDSVLSHYLNKHIQSCSECNEHFKQVSKGLELISQRVHRQYLNNEILEDILAQREYGLICYVTPQAEN